jgi:large subunit ribosomal protein L9
MQVILLERVEKLGQMGDEVKVKDGFARNFLLPHKKALRANKENREYFSGRRAQLEAENLERRSEAEKVAEKLKDKVFALIRQAGDRGQLYGSVSTRDIAEAITKGGFTVNRNQVPLDKPIKTIGLFPMMVVLHPEVRVAVTINVARNEDEAERQAKGEDVLAEKVAEEAEAAAAAAEMFEEGAAPKAEDEAEAADVATEETKAE